VTQNVFHIRRVPVEACEFVYQSRSIYGICIYRQCEGEHR
jgi:hypothetical protein